MGCRDGVKTRDCLLRAFELVVGQVEQSLPFGGRGRSMSRL